MLVICDKFVAGSTSVWVQRVHNINLMRVRGLCQQHALLFLHNCTFTFLVCVYFSHPIMFGAILATLMATVPFCVAVSTVHLKVVAEPSVSFCQRVFGEVALRTLSTGASIGSLVSQVAFRCGKLVGTITKSIVNAGGVIRAACVYAAGNVKLRTGVELLTGRQFRVRQCQQQQRETVAKKQPAQPTSANSDDDSDGSWASDDSDSDDSPPPDTSCDAEDQVTTSPDTSCGAEDQVTTSPDTSCDAEDQVTTSQS